MNAITEIPLRSTLQPMDFGLDRQLALACNALVRNAGAVLIPQERSPSEPVRRALAQRRAEIARQLQPCGPRHVVVEVGALFQVMATRGGGEGSAEVARRIYVEDLKDVPAFALTVACQDFRQGRVGDGKWVPTPGEIRRQAYHHVAPYAVESKKIGDVLEAKVQGPPVNRERIQGELEALGAHMKAMCDPMKRHKSLSDMTVAEANRIADARNFRSSPINVSDSLRKSIAEHAAAEAANPLGDHP